MVKDFFLQSFMLVENREKNTVGGLAARPHFNVEINRKVSMDVMDPISDIRERKG